MYVCRWCGSDRIAWSHETGYIVCMQCGAVQGMILEGEPPMYMPRITTIRTPGLGPVEDKVRKAASLGLVVRVTRRGLVLDNPANNKARRALKASRDLRTIYEHVKKDPILGSRTLRGRVGIAIYIMLRLQGVSSRKALLEASKGSGASIYTLAKITRKYRGRIEALIARIENGDSGSEGGGEEDTRADV